MIARIIEWSLKNRMLVLLGAMLLTGWGIYSSRHMALDAIPDLSDVQVIIKTAYPGQPPQMVEDQVTYPDHVRILVGAGLDRGARFFHVWRIICIRDVPGWH